MKKYKLLKDMPYCPNGSVFEENKIGDFVCTSDGECSYIFSKKEIEESEEWFEEIVDAFKYIKIEFPSVKIPKGATIIQLSEVHGVGCLKKQVIAELLLKDGVKVTLEKIIHI